MIITNTPTITIAVATTLMYIILSQSMEEAAIHYLNIKSTVHEYYTSIYSLMVATHVAIYHTVW